MLRIGKSIVCAALLILASGQTSTFGAIGASITYTSEQIGPSSYQYSVTLQNTGTTPIGTFWFGWIPGYDFMPSVASVTSPTGWTGASIHEAIGSYAIEWYDTGTPLAAGNSLSGFTFTTPDSPDTISGPSFFGPYYPVNTSWVYVGALQSGFDINDQGASILPAAVPEPTSIMLLPAGLLLLRKRK